MHKYLSDSSFSDLLIFYLFYEPWCYTLSVEKKYKVLYQPNSKKSCEDLADTQYPSRLENEAVNMAFYQSTTDNSEHIDIAAQCPPKLILTSTLCSCSGRSTDSR